MAKLNSKTPEIGIRCRRKAILEKGAELNHRAGQEIMPEAGGRPS